MAVWPEIDKPNDIDMDSADAIMGEAIKDNPSKGGLSWEGADESLEFVVPFEREYDACCKILGYAYVDMAFVNSTPGSQALPSGSTGLKRVNPMRHPWKPWLVAVNIPSITRYGARRYETTNQKAYFPTQPKYAIRYEKSILQVQFSVPPFECLEDNEIYEEYERYVDWNGEPNSTWLSSEGSGTRWKYVSAPVAGQNVPASVPYSYLESQLEIGCTWYRVPEQFACLEKGAPPVAWFGTMGFANNLPWPRHWGPEARYLSQTLVVLPFKWTRHPMPIRTLNKQVMYYVTIAGKFLYFDCRDEYRGDTYHGHNSVPSPDDSYKYHLFTVDGTVGGIKKYPLGSGIAPNKLPFMSLFRYKYKPDKAGDPDAEITTA